jgi:hypothetical protein
MSNARISELPAASALADADLAPVVQGVGAAAETRRATLTQLRAAAHVERSFHVRDFGAVGDGVTDDVLAFQAAIDAAETAGGGIVMIGPRRYAITGAELVIKPGVTLKGDVEPGGWRPNGTWSTVNQALLLSPLRTIRLRRNSALEGLAIFRQGLVAPTSVRTAFDAVAAFAGTAVSMGDGTTGGSPGNGTDSAVRKLLIIGFATGIRSDGSSRVRIEDVLGDCVNGLWLGGNYDISHVSRVNWHPLFTTGYGWSNSSIGVSAVANNGVGLYRVTTGAAHSLVTGDVVNINGALGQPALNRRWVVTVINTTTIDLQGSSFAAGYTSGAVAHYFPNRRRGTAFYVRDADMPKFVSCFEYGHDIGFHIDDLSHCLQLTNCGVDHLNTVADDAAIGVQITGTATRTKWSGGFWAAKGRLLIVNSTNPDHHEIANVMLASGFGASARSVEVQDGGVSLIGCDIYGQVFLGANADSVIVTGCDTKSTSYAAASGAAMQRLVIVGNRSLSATPITHRVMGGMVELATTDNANATIVPRLTARFDGPVSIHRQNTTAGAALRLHGANDLTFGGMFVLGTNLVFQGDSANNPNPSFVFGGNGMSAPATVRFRRISASPAALDRVSVLELAGNNSALAENVYVRIAAVSDVVTAGSEAGSLVFETRLGAGFTERLRIAPSGPITANGPLVLPGDPAGALEAAPRQYVDNHSNVRRVPVINISTTIALTHAAHNARVVTASGAAAFSIDWAASGDGFRVAIINRTAAAIAVTMTGFTATTPANPDGHTRIRAGGMAELFAYTPDAGATRVLHLSGQTAP